MSDLTDRRIALIGGAGLEVRVPSGGGYALAVPPGPGPCRGADLG